MAFANLTAVAFSRDQVAIAVTNTDFGSDGHIGIGFHSAKAGPKVLHLAWHQMLRVDSVPSDLKRCWAANPLEMPQSASKQLVALIRSIAARGPSINYGIDFVAAKNSFTANGTYKPGKRSDGLTCASFVVEVLRAGAVKLVNEHTWKDLPENIEWGNAVCKALAASKVPVSTLPPSEETLAEHGCGPSRLQVQRTWATSIGLRTSMLCKSRRSSSLCNSWTFAHCRHLLRPSQSKADGQPFVPVFVSALFGTASFVARDGARGV